MQIINVLKNSVHVTSSDVYIFDLVLYDTVAFMIYNIQNKDKDLVTIWVTRSFGNATIAGFSMLSGYRSLWC